MNHEISILYVEDEKYIRDELTEILALDFKKLYVASNGEEGIELYQKHRPELVISDIQMPKMDGLLLSKKILEIDSQAKIILTTAFNEESHLKESKNLNIFYYIKKPIDLNDLYIAIERVVKSLQR